MSQDFFPNQEQESDDYNAFNNQYLNPPLVTISVYDNGKCPQWGPSRAFVQAGLALYHVINMNNRT